jgi:biotin transport system permease protein
MVGLYRRRNTPLHRVPAGFKILALIGLTIATLYFTEPVVSVGLAAASVLLLASTTPPARATLVTMAWVTLIAVISAGLQVWSGDLMRGIDVGADLIAVVALALAVSSSTSMSEMLDVISFAARPLSPILPPETIALMFALMIRAIPEAAQIWGEARQAARARGMQRSFIAVAVPTATRSVGFAMQLGQALHARGIADHAPAVAKAPAQPEPEETDADPSETVEHTVPNEGSDTGATDQIVNVADAHTPDDAAESDTAGDTDEGEGKS